ncbi:MAG: amidase family protein [Pseudomonadota bacterium]
MQSDEFYRMSATEAVLALRQRELQPTDLIQAAIQRIEQVDGDINALPIRCFERALAQAKTQEVARGQNDPKILAGLPIAVKDYNDVGGLRTTYGSPIYCDHVADQSDVTVARLEQNGAIPIAKSNVPEWAGGHTFNPVNGLTRNPWNLARSAGGSSGGSAAALASGQGWAANRQYR